MKIEIDDTVLIDTIVEKVVERRGTVFVWQLCNRILESGLRPIALRPTLSSSLPLIHYHHIYNIHLQYLAN